MHMYVKFAIKSVQVASVTGITKVGSSTEQSNCDSHCRPDVVRHDGSLSSQRTSAVALQVQRGDKVFDRLSAIVRTVQIVGSSVLATCLANLFLLNYFYY